MSCPLPFLPLVDYPERDGDINGRVCATIPVDGFPKCCLPCPRQQWVYPDNFMPLITGSTYLNLVGVVCCVFLLLSFALLSVEYTNRHYLSVCLVTAILILQMSFVIPMGTKSTQCYDPITPHDMYSSSNCALSGALVLGGGWCVACWILLRSLSLHLQICWQVVPGRRFFLAAQAIGWSVPLIFLAIALGITGVSFRFGDSCHINSKDSLKTFWGPLLATAAASVITQVITFFYCVKVYITSLLDGSTQGNTTTDTPLPYANSVRTVTPRQAFRRIQRVIALQWRGIMVVIVIITDVIFFATVFLKFEDTTQSTPENTLKALNWLQCILKNNGDKNMCLDVASKMVVPEATAVAVIYLLSFNGIWAALLIGRWSMLVGWWHLIKDLFNKKKSNDEFVSFNARRLSEPDPSYEMLGCKETTISFTSETLSSSPGMLRITPTTNQSSLPKSYTLRSSMLSSTLDSPGTDINSPNGNLQFSLLTDKGGPVPEGEKDFHQTLSPKPPPASYRKP
ncbi:hypothetical protein BGX38DRAFT_1242847 [Terfezia claveryi]|nr:hypothetical protein BGX38DRAFT_1242847 [Terfezia claveryi]